MLKETMTRKERMWAAINLEPMDRIPVAPILGQFVMRQRGISRNQRVGNVQSYYHAAGEIFEMLGGYDAQYGIGYALSSWRVNSATGKNVAPGEEGVPEHFSVQFREEENMSIKDYDTIIDKGWNKFCEDYFKRNRGVSLEEMDRRAKAQLEVIKKEAKVWDERGCMILTGGLIVSCEMSLSLARTLPQFTLDLHRIPDKVQAALEAMVPDFIRNTIDDCRTSGIPWVHISLERGSGSYYSLKMYERFFFPQLKKIVTALTGAGIMCMLHMDTDWTLNLPYLKELPAKKCICNLDSITDIFKAKEILKGHMCIMGDVPPSLNALGTPEEVTAYCEKLIDVVGKDGGFILCSGCEVPIDAKFENVKAMVDSVKNHPYPHSSDKHTGN